MKKKTYGSFEVNKYMHEHEKRVLEGLLFLSGDEGLSIEQLNGCVEELDKKEIEVVLDELMPISSRSLVQKSRKYAV